MKPATEKLISEVLAYLETLNQDGVRPADARQLLRDLQVRHLDTVLELVWEGEPFDGSVHYDVLLHLPDATTLSLSHCRAGGLPWPLRGVRRFNEANLLQVNGRTLTMEDGVEFLDVLWREAPLLQRMVNALLIREELDREPVEIGETELQLGLDGLRRAHKLYTADETQRWMDERGLTHERLEYLLRENLSLDKLRARVSAGQVGRRFEANPDAHARVAFARLELADLDTAERVRRTVLSGEADFLSAAGRHFLAEPLKSELRFASICGREAVEPLGAALFAAGAGELVGPFVVDGVVVLARVLAHQPAVLDAATRADIEEQIFDEWLAARRAAARITWQWGTADALARVQDPR